MKVASYNILDGGTGRLDALAETIAHIDADFTGICEAQHPRHIEYLARKLGMQGLVAEARDGQHHVALLTRLPLHWMVNLGSQLVGFARGTMAAVVRTPGGGSIRCVVTHLSSGQNAEDEPQRVRELTAVLAALEEQPMPTILMGDLNAAAPYHPFDYHAASPRVKQRLEKRNTHRLDHELIRMLMDGGWTDCHLHARPDEHRHTYTTGFPCSRFDYLWVTPDLTEAVRDAGVETGGFAPYCSDHYPVWAVLDA